MSASQTPCPSFLRPYTFIATWTTEPDKLEDIWGQLQRRETFVKGQPFPYRVEFESGHKTGEFAEGELNIHHGPFLSAHGAIGQISETQRDLNYFYGSYALSFRWVRPQKLVFRRKDDQLIMELSFFVRPLILPWVRAGLVAYFYVFGRSRKLSQYATAHEMP